jgi:putative tryptophan/tyrosine transport system substrate-binding protein
LTRDVVDTRPDAIYALEGTLGVAFKAASTTIPIVATSFDPVALGLVSNIARPGGNVTGTAIDAGMEIWGKRIGLIKEALPKLSNVRIIAQSRKGWEGLFGSAVRQAGKAAAAEFFLSDRIAFSHFAVRFSIRLPPMMVKACSMKNPGRRLYFR